MRGKLPSKRDDEVEVRPDGFAIVIVDVVFSTTSSDEGKGCGISSCFRNLIANFPVRRSAPGDISAFRG